MKILSTTPGNDWTLRIVADDGRSGVFDVKPYLDLSAFEPLCNVHEFARLRSGGYYIEWACGADLSADTIEAHLVADPA